MPKVKGTVKWFSNQKGYGFITPDEGSPTTEDIFVHQTCVNSNGFRSLDEGWAVEFTIGEDDGNKVKAENVTAPGGGVCTGPSSRRSRGSRRKPKDQENADGGNENDGTTNASSGRERGNSERTPRDTSTFWHASLNPEVKAALDTKGIRSSTGTIDISIGNARVKLGTGGYSSVAHADGILGEGTFSCEVNGKATFVWEKVMVFQNGEWATTTAGECDLPRNCSLIDDSVDRVKPDETALTLWGEGPADPRPALETNDFLMRRVVLTPRRGR